MAPSRAQIAQWLLDARTRAGKSRRKASVLLDVAEKTVQRWEDPDDTPMPPADQFLALVVFYEADILELLAKRSARSGATSGGASGGQTRKTG